MIFLKKQQNKHKKVQTVCVYVKRTSGFASYVHYLSKAKCGSVSPLVSFACSLIRLKCECTTECDACGHNSPTESSTSFQIRFALP